MCKKGSGTGDILLLRHLAVRKVFSIVAPPNRCSGGMFRTRYLRLHLAYEAAL